MCYVKCSYGTYREGAHSYCTNCPLNCKDCTSSLTCSDCNDGYFVKNGICYTCTSSCFTCFDISNKSCLSCDPSTELFLF